MKINKELSVKPNNPYYKLIEIYSGRQVQAGEVVDGIPAGPGVQAQNLDLNGSYFKERSLHSVISPGAILMM